MNEKPKTRSEQKREAIIEAAKRGFREHGVQGTSMDALAELAQVSKRTVYNHFATKEELVIHLLSDLWAQSMIQVEVPYRADEALEGQLGELVQAEIDLVSGRDFLGLARAATDFFLYQPEKLHEMVSDFHAEDTAFHHWLRAAVADGRLVSMDIDFAVRQLHNLVKGSCYFPQLLGYEGDLGADEKQRLADETVRMFLDRYRSKN